MLRSIGLTGAATILAAGLFAVPSAVASSNARYEVTVTNLTAGQTLTPLLMVTHRQGIELFEAGTAASAELEALAEEGNVAPLQAQLDATRGVHETVNAVDVLGPPPASLLPPGQSVTHEIWARGSGSRLSLMAMMIPTNDAFAAVSSVRLPGNGRQITYTGVAYDAGTEVNDQLCTSIPGPFCPPNSPGAGQDEGGVVHVHTGIHGIGDLSPAEYDWRNPVIRVVIKRVR